MQIYRNVIMIHYISVHEKINLSVDKLHDGDTVSNLLQLEVKVNMDQANLSVKTTVLQQSM